MDLSPEGVGGSRNSQNGPPGERQYLLRSQGVGRGVPAEPGKQGGGVWKQASGGRGRAELVYAGASEAGRAGEANDIGGTSVLFGGGEKGGGGRFRWTGRGEIERIGALFGRSAEKVGGSDGKTLSFRIFCKDLVAN